MAETIHGLDNIERNLKALPGRKMDNAVRRSLRKGANAIRDRARQNAKSFDDPGSPEKIWKNIATTSGGKRRERRAGGPMLRVGVRGGARNMSAYGEISGRGKGNPGGDTFYWRFLEFGTRNMAARPFMRPAMMSAKSEAFSRTALNMESELAKELAKLQNSGR